MTKLALCHSDGSISDIPTYREDPYVMNRRHPFAWRIEKHGIHIQGSQWPKKRDEDKVAADVMAVIEKAGVKCGGFRFEGMPQLNASTVFHPQADAQPLAQRRNIAIQVRNLRNETRTVDQHISVTWSKRPPCKIWVDTDEE